MAETSAPAKPTTPSRESLVKHIEAVKAETLKLVGTVALNPYLYIKRNVTPLEQELASAKDVSPELAAKIVALKPAVLAPKAPAPAPAPAK